MFAKWPLCSILMDCTRHSRTMHWKTIWNGCFQIVQCLWCLFLNSQCDCEDPWCGAIWFEILVDYLVNLVTFFFCVKRFKCVTRDRAMQLWFCWGSISIQCDSSARETWKKFTVARFYLSIRFMCIQLKFYFHLFYYATLVVFFLSLHLAFSRRLLRLIFFLVCCNF